MKHRTIELCNLNISAGSLDTHVEILRKAAFSGCDWWVLTCNLEMLSRAASDPEYHQMLQQPHLVTADGMPLVWASRLKKPGYKIEGRTTGVDLVIRLLTEEPVPRFAIIGGENPREALRRLSAPMEKAFVFDGLVRFDDEWLLEITKALQAHQTQILFVALGTPKAEQLITCLRPHLLNTVMLGVGGAFDMIAGLKPRAPVWMQNMGIEWLHRLKLEPQRLWRRYLLLYPRGLFWLITDVIKGRILKKA